MARTSLERLAAEHRACSRCVEAGFIPSARPVFSGRAGQRILLVGQAPGPVEVDERRPFAGRAGRQLMRWLSNAGFAGESDVRRRVWMTSVTTCFPGRLPGGGDRRPSPAEVQLCAPWLDGVLELLQPRLILLVGGLAQQRLLRRHAPLSSLVGRAFDAAGTEVPASPPPRPPVLLPLPHPSGQSRWLNDPAHAVQLAAALRLLAALLPWAEAGGATLP